MENYSGIIDMAIIEELGIDWEREYLRGKYGHDFAEETIRIIETRQIQIDRDPEL
jgi:hypothetical protein